ncbi:MAG: hypothetical protein EPO51_17720 [Phenylobacterium sp.]|uniref:hypothetical protein n=1 Tax=Phenylobacterium sp. TaxID=1871053 RepID=UPI00121ACBD0|nr:hypothetical protein [Phenylobacterium sp.]TAJ70371.1 MAG: hypothetical protein EPO51_17720 [Phenylobacterium sp.]
MKKIILGLTVAAATFAAGAAMAQPYGYRGEYRDYRGGYERDYRYDRGYRDSDRDGIPDRREWNRDRDRDGRPDQYDRYDNRRDRHHHRGWDRRDHGRYDYRYDDRGGYYR